MANAKCTSKPLISTKAAKYIMQVVTKNFITRGYSCAKIAQEVKKLRGHFIAPKIMYKILKDEGYLCYNLTIKLRLNKDIKKA